MITTITTSSLAKPLGPQACGQIRDYYLDPDPDQRYLQCQQLFCRCKNLSIKEKRSVFLTLNEPATRWRIVDRVEVKLDLTTDQ
jgi:hypothetical protein